MLRSHSAAAVARRASHAARLLAASIGTAILSPRRAASSVTVRAAAQPVARSAPLPLLQGSPTRLVSGRCFSTASSPSAAAAAAPFSTEDRLVYHLISTGGRADEVALALSRASSSATKSLSSPQLPPCTVGSGRGGGVLASAPVTGQSPLHAALAAGRADLISLLLDAGADPNACDTRFRTPLYYLPRLQPEDVQKALRLLLVRGASLNPNVAETPSSEAAAVLIRSGAAAHENVSLVAAAAAELAPVPALPHALLVGLSSSAPTAAALPGGALEEDTDLIPASPGTPSDTLAASVVDALIALGVSPQLQSPPSGATLLHAAAAAGNVTVVRALAQDTPSLLVAVDSQGNSALHAAVRGQSHAAITAVLSLRSAAVAAAADAGAPVVAGSEDPLSPARLNFRGVSAAALAVVKGDRGTFEWLLSHIASAPSLGSSSSSSWEMQRARSLGRVAVEALRALPAAFPALSARARDVAAASLAGSDAANAGTKDVAVLTRRVLLQEYARLLQVCCVVAETADAAVAASSVAVEDVPETSPGLPEAAYVIDPAAEAQVDALVAELAALARGGGLLPPLNDADSVANDSVAPTTPAAEAASPAAIAGTGGSAPLGSRGGAGFASLAARALEAALRAAAGEGKEPLVTAIASMASAHTTEADADATSKNGSTVWSLFDAQAQALGSGATALMRACAYTPTAASSDSETPVKRDRSRVRMVKALLSCSNNPAASDWTGKTALHHCGSSWALREALMLVHHAAPPSSENSLPLPAPADVAEALVRAADRDGMNLLHHLASSPVAGGADGGGSDWPDSQLARHYQPGGNVLTRDDAAAILLRLCAAADASFTAEKRAAGPAAGAEAFAQLDLMLEGLMGELSDLGEGGSDLDAAFDAGARAEELDSALDRVLGKMGSVDSSTGIRPTTLAPLPSRILAQTADSEGRLPYALALASGNAAAGGLLHALAFCPAAAAAATDAAQKAAAAGAAAFEWEGADAGTVSEVVAWAAVVEAVARAEAVANGITPGKKDASSAPLPAPPASLADVVRHLKPPSALPAVDPTVSSKLAAGSASATNSAAAEVFAALRPDVVAELNALAVSTSGREATDRLAEVLLSLPVSLRPALTFTPPRTIPRARAGLAVTLAAAAARAGAAPQLRALLAFGVAKESICDGKRLGEIARDAGAQECATELDE